MLIEILKFLSIPIIMFGVSFAFVSFMWHLQDKEIERKVKRDYPKWYRDYWTSKG